MGFMGILPYNHQPRDWGVRLRVIRLRSQGLRAVGFSGVGFKGSKPFGLRV